MAITTANVIKWLENYAALLNENKAYLTDLDSEIGDADHGINMDRGFQAVLEKLPGTADGDIGTVLKTAAMALISSVGGASGPLYGTLFLEMAKSADGKAELTLEEWAAALEAGVEGVARRGKANAGDKTMLDALFPAVEELKQVSSDGSDLKEALQASREAAERGMKDTIPMVAKKGRASYLGGRSAGHQDPGATSSFLMLKAAAESLV